MTRQITIRRLLVILMIAGLVLAPLSRPRIAGAMSDTNTPMADASMSAMADEAMAGDMSGANMSAPAMTGEMASDMPCCPSKAPMPIGCDKCVFMAACSAQCFSGMTVALFQPPFAVSARLARPRDDSWRNGLGRPPPEYPPRTLV